MMPSRYISGLAACPPARGPWAPPRVHQPRAIAGSQMPGFQAALRGIFIYTTRKQAMGSKWFGPTGLLGPARGAKNQGADSAGESTSQCLSRDCNVEYHAIPWNKCSWIFFYRYGKDAKH
jgi:hypothetical protein